MKNLLGVIFVAVPALFLLSAFILLLVSFGLFYVVVCVILPGVLGGVLSACVFGGLHLIVNRQTKKTTKEKHEKNSMENNPSWFRKEIPATSTCGPSGIYWQWKGDSKKVIVPPPKPEPPPPAMGGIWGPDRFVSKGSFWNLLWKGKVKS